MKPSLLGDRASPDYYKPASRTELILIISVSTYHLFSLLKMPRQKFIPIKKIIKYLSCGTVIALSLLGVFSILFMIHVATTGSHDSHTKQTISRHRLIKLDQAIDEFHVDNQSLPQVLSDLVFETQNPKWMGPYIREKELTDPWGKKYHYQLFQHAEGYQLYTLGSDHLIGGSDQKQDQISKGSLFIINQTNTHAKRNHIHIQNL